MELASCARRDLGRILRFVAVGSAGFVADATILLWLVERFNADHIGARLISAPAAILLTFALNRHWSFRDIDQPSLVRSFASYLSVQSFGFALNLLAYSLMLLTVSMPAVALVVASIVAMVLNYLGSRYWAFRA